jgi:5-methyltetrahydrofolate--homocysteine methyltransferase
MADLLAALRSGRVLLMDGAMGTELQRRGLKPGVRGEAWCLTHPRRVRAVHQAYADAGAEVLLTNTFQSNPSVLARHGVADELENIGEAACAVARSCAPAFVLGDIGPIPWDQAKLEAGRRVARALQTADALLVETCSDLNTLALVQLWRDKLPTPLPLLFSLTFFRMSSGDLRLYPDDRPERLLRKLRWYAVDGLGVNCGRDIGMDEVIEIVRRYRAIADLPLFARPNAGTPTRQGKRWVYPHTPEAMAARLPELLEAGVSMVGGCCGTTPEHIAAFRPVVEEWNRRRRA